MSFVASTRFNNDTWNENTLYKNKHEIRGTIYCQRIRIKASVPIGAPLYVIEMNNSTNQIFGVGLIRNSVTDDKYYKVYSSHDFNRHIYKGEHHLDRDEMIAINPDIVARIEQMCFKGKTHLKRLPGISVVSDKLLTASFAQNSQLKQELRNMFLNKYKTKNADFDLDAADNDLNATKP